MSHYPQTLLSHPDRFNYSMITPQYSPDTTIAIIRRQFEKEAKAEAERDYDAKRGPLPPSPADDDDSIDIKERTIMKKGRKVRSAIVSRKKTAIYEKKLEKALQQRDNINKELKDALSLSQDVLRGIRGKIQYLQRTLDARKEVPKRMRTALPPQTFNPIPQQPNLFLNEDDPIEDILSIQSEEPRQLQPVSKSFHSVSDFTSECSDRQISPMLQTQPSHAIQRDFQSNIPIEDNSWKAYMPQHIQQPVAQMLGAAFSM